MKDNTFIAVGVAITIPILIIMAIVARTGATILAFIGVIILLDAMCYVAHCSVNSRR